MEKKALLLMALFISVMGYSQLDPNLYNMPWFLNNIQVDGVTYFAPANNEVEFVRLDISETSPNFVTAVCDMAEADIESVDPFTTFRFPSGLNITPVTCTNGDNEIFEDRFFNDFFIANIDGDFEYAISIIDGNVPNYVLDIWWGNGNSASFYDKVLNVPSNELGKIAVYQNPVNEVLNLRFVSEMSFPLTISMIDTSGRLFFSENLEESVISHQLDVNNMPNGLYFVQIEDVNGNKTVKRVVR